MEKLVIDLSKANLNFSKLVKKRVMVRGKNGKTFYRMQWVSPEQASTGNGVRQINSVKGLNQAIKDGIHKHPQFSEAMKEQGVDIANHMQNHPPFYLPETEESAKNYYNHVNNLLRTDSSKYEEEMEHHQHWGHGMHPPGHEVFGEHDLVGEDEADAIQGKYSVHPEIKNLIDECVKSVSRDSGKSDRYGSSYKPEQNQLYAISYNLRKKFPVLRDHIANKIRETTDNKFVRAVQLNALKEGNMKHNFLAGAHPDIARETVNHILGEEVANRLRKSMDNATLTINYPEEHKDSIKKNGYKALDMFSYAKKLESTHPGITEELEKIVDNEEGLDIEDQLSAIGELDSNLWERAEAEYRSIGLHPEDRKPTYIAFNPDNESDILDFYGEGMLSMKDPEKILKYCTATMDDSFNTDESFAKIWSMDHLKDIFILKAIDKTSAYGHDLYGSKEFNYSGWNEKAKVDIPIELQYHFPELKPDDFTMQDGDSEREDLTGDNSLFSDKELDNFDDLDLDKDVLKFVKG